MKSKYLCPVCCGELQSMAHFPDDSASAEEWEMMCMGERCSNEEVGYGKTEHLAYEKLIERVKGEGK